MSLDVYLIQKGKTVFEYNITHNLVDMADAVDLYKALWRPEEIGRNTAKELSPLLEKGLISLIKGKKNLLKYEPDNGWGSHQGLIDFTIAYLQACIEYPNANIKVSR